MKYRSLNESIVSVTNPQPELTQNEYIELLESALISIAEELECDVEDLVEASMTPARKAVLDRSEREANFKHYNAQLASSRMPRDFNYSKLRISGDKREAESRINRINNLRAIGSGAPNRKSEATKLRKQHQSIRRIQKLMNSD